MTKLIDVLANPQIILTLSLEDLSFIIAEARYFNMLAQLECICQLNGLWQDLPLAAKRHIKAANRTFINQKIHLQHEAELFKTLFSAIQIEWIYLKGSAYHLANFEEFQGRLMADIDILVAEEQLPIVEVRLKEQGWLPTKLSDYDQHFYRQWSQEIPPLRHIKRQTELDIHFNILPKTLKESPNQHFLLEQTVYLSPMRNESLNKSKAKILTPPAMIIHAAIHLFYESEYHKGLRDLYDLYLLFNKFSTDPSFWNQLEQLQSKFDDGRSTFYALRYCHELLGLAVPENILSFYQKYKPNNLSLLISDFIFRRAFCYSYPAHKRPAQKLTEIILYCRGHMKRMPLYLLIPHLGKKLLITLFLRANKQSSLI